MEFKEFLKEKKRVIETDEFEIHHDHALQENCSVYDLVEDPIEIIAIEDLNQWTKEQALIENAIATQQELNSLYDKHKAREKVYLEIADACSDKKMEGKTNGKRKN